MQGRSLDKTNAPDYLILDKLIPEDHLLRKVNKHIHFSFVNDLTEKYYSQNNGRPSIPPELYFRMMLINLLFAIKSTRRLVQEIYYDISYRWFCGLTWKDSIPNHASLSRIKKKYS
nr:IS1182 family transposase [Legionella fairfieldensis]